MSGISSELVDLIITLDELQSYLELVALLQKVDTKFRACKGFSNYYPKSSTTKSYLQATTSTTTTSTTSTATL